MNDAVLKIGSISIYGYGILAVFSFLWGSFIFYKKATESHFEDYYVLDGVVLSSFWALIVGRIVFAMLNFSAFFNHLGRLFLLSEYPGIDKWGVILGVSFGLYLAVRKLKAKYLDWFDFVTLGLTSAMTIFYAGLSILSMTWQYLVVSFLLLGVFVILWRIEDTYRTMSWYRNKKNSAKSGLISGFSISAWGLVSILELLIFSKSNLASIAWGIFLFVGGLVLVYIRSGRTASEDIKIIFKNGKKQ